MSFFTRNIYRKDITSILFLKAIGLFLLWFFFFAHPVDHRLTTNQLTERYMNTVR